ncbi:MAG: TetR/AcrR family transcriptional regulator, partial [Ruminococcaceae bacterium]|nr:TetR/AcrR family transcriptional regulator [Oscillospiraceae bacterium]
MNSKEKIIEKYIELVLKKRTPDISVTELCEETGISRNTFYHYFQDRYSVVEAIFINDIEDPMKMGFEMEIHSEIVTSIMYRNFLKK